MGLEQVPVAVLHHWLAILMIISGVATFVTLLFLNAPYGRYARGGWGPMINTRLAWMSQEVPSLLIAVAFCWSAGLDSFVRNPTSTRTVATVLFLSHYVYRSLVYPLLITSAKRMPLSIWAMSFTFCVWNGFLQGYSLAYVMPRGTPVDVLSATGFALQAFGLLNVILADNILIHLRKPGETEYKIPYGGFFALVSAGNYSAEILEWTGYAIGAQSLSAVAFAVFAFSNLAPRGVQHHAWYKSKFEDYPKSRKAVIPFIW